MKLPFTKKIRVRVFFALLSLGIGIGGGIAYYLITEKFTDTKNITADYSLSAPNLLSAFQENDSVANALYRDKILELSGRISSIEWTDTSATVNIEAHGSSDYLIFDFQNKDAGEIKTIQNGDSVSIRAACSGSIYSRILHSRSIQFKRATLIKKF